MSVLAKTTPPEAVVYPDSDGQPMADNMTQFRWIATIQGGLDVLLPNAVVAGDNLIYPVEGHPGIRQAPGVYVALGRPKGERGSYKVWEEGGVFPQVVFEVRSPSNRAGELARKLSFYDQYGAQEYYIYDPDRHRLTAYLRTPDGLEEVSPGTDFVSPLLAVRFDMSGPELVIRGPNGRPLQTYAELDAALTAERQRAEQERQRAEKLAAKLRELGVDPDAV